MDDPIGQLQRNKSHQSARDDGVGGNHEESESFNHQGPGFQSDIRLRNRAIHQYSAQEKFQCGTFQRKRYPTNTLATLAFTVALGFFFSDTILPGHGESHQLSS